MTYTTKDSGKKRVFDSGFHRDASDSKLRFDLIPIDQLERLAGQFTRGAEKYGANNRQKAIGESECDAFRQSAYRHFIKWMKGEYDEDHAAAIIWNIMCYEWHKDHGHLKNPSE